MVECYHCNMRGKWAIYYEIDRCCEFVSIYGYDKPQKETKQTVLGFFGGRGFGIEESDGDGGRINPKIHRMIYSNRD